MTGKRSSSWQPTANWKILNSRKNGRVSILELPPASIGWFPPIADEILDLTDQVASAALLGPIGIGKSFVARTVLDHNRTKAKFGENRHSMCCDGLENSLEGFIQRLSGTIHVNETHLESHLKSSPPLILLLDSVDSALDPLSPEAEKIRARIEEFGSYEHVCLITTSRMYPDIHGFHRVNIATPPEGGAQDIFYSLCNLDRSPALDILVAKLDLHPFSIELFARTVRENSWDEQTLLRMWDDKKGVLRTTYYEMLKKTIEPVFRSPRIKELGTAARDVLEAIASFPSGIEEHQLEGIFHRTGGVREVVDVLRSFSLVSCRNGALKMLSPLQFYFLESMIVYAETEEVIKWGPDLLPVYTGGPPNGWLLDPSPLRLTILQKVENPPGQPCPPVSTCEFTSGGLSHTTPDREAPRRRKWIRRLPQIVKKRLLALFGRQIAPIILIDIQEVPADIPSTGLRENPTNIPVTATQDDLPEILPIAEQEDPTNLSLVTTQDDLPEITPSVAQEDPTNFSPVAAQENVATMPLTVPRQQIPPAVVAYNVDW
ncbi:hypothetical protein BJ322DRAFT_1148999 [Thelephora terrestris]|uniref:Uncharacterized protein n=1 Tax=Thelephora terrestris TaxID=56493 RepID=A0A9P6LBP7_9AGAM|nr:hypothetical protein BJ322DRAFT_1148999 [Thelephora terrestris]